MCREGPHSDNGSYWTGFWLALRPLVRGRRLGNLTHRAERRIGARYDDIVGFDKTLRKADRAAGLDHVRLDGEPLSDLRAADVIHREPDCHHIRPAQLMPAAITHRVVGERRNQPAVN